MNFEILKTELQDAKYAAMTDQQASDDLNAVTITVKQSISAHDIRKYLMLVDKLLPIESSVLDSAKAGNRSLEIFPEFDMTDAVVEAKLIAVLDALVVDTLLSAGDKTTILALGDKVVSRAEQLGLPVLNEENVRFARGL